MRYANDMPVSTSAPSALATSLRIAVMRLARRLQRERTDDSLSTTQLAAMATLDRHGPMSPGELATHERVQPPSMTRVLAVLEERGYVERMPHATDRRQAVVRLTRAGREVVLAERRRREAWLAQRLRHLEPAELETLQSAAEILERLARS